MSAFTDIGGELLTPGRQYSYQQRNANYEVLAAEFLRGQGRTTPGSVLYHILHNEQPLNTVGKVGDWARRDTPLAFWEKTAPSVWTLRNSQGDAKFPFGVIQAGRTIFWGPAADEITLSEPIAHGNMYNIVYEVGYSGSNQEGQKTINFDADFSIVPNIVIRDSFTSLVASYVRTYLITFNIARESINANCVFSYGLGASSSDYTDGTIGIKKIINLGAITHGVYEGIE